MIYLANKFHLTQLKALQLIMYVKETIKSRFHITVRRESVAPILLLFYTLFDEAPEGRKDVLYMVDPIWELMPTSSGKLPTFRPTMIKEVPCVF